MTILIFCHSLLSDWNHGNAHFLRGVATELLHRGHTLRVYEPKGAWSLQNLIADAGYTPLAGFGATYPTLAVPGVNQQYDPETLDLRGELEDADVVLVHEWNEPKLVAQIDR